MRQHVDASVLLPQVYPLVHSGSVVVLKTGFGFLESGDGDARSRVYFAASEVSYRG